MILAECISRRGMVAAPETIITARAQQRALPDVIVTFYGLRCAIEGKSGDVQNAHEQLKADAAERVETGIAYMAIAVVYPATLRTTAFAELGAARSYGA